MDAVEKRVAEKLGFRVTTEQYGHADDKETRILYDGASCDIIGMPRQVQRLWDALLAAERRQEWIKVTPESMPPIGKYVNVVCNGVVQFNAAQFTGHCWEWYPQDEFDPAPKDEVTHWRELPAAPPEEVEP